MILQDTPRHISDCGTSLPLTDEDTDLLQTALSMLNQPANQRDEDGLKLVLTQVAHKIEDILKYA